MKHLTIIAMALAFALGVAFQAPVFAADEQEAGTTWKAENFKLDLKGFGQVRFTAKEDDKYLGDSASRDELRIQRLRLTSLMTADKGLSGFFQLDLVEKYPVMDAWAKIDLGGNMWIKAGQFVIPFGWQMPLSPYSLHTINYGQINTSLCPVSGAFRDQGATFGGTIGKRAGEQENEWKHDEKGVFSWELGFFNGKGRYGNDDSSAAKLAIKDDEYFAFCGRIGFTPVSPWTQKRVYKGQLQMGAKSSDLLDFGLSYWMKSVPVEGVGKYTKGRFGFDFRLHQKMGERDTFIFQGEFVTNVGDLAEVDSNGDFEAGELGEAKATGYFFELGYRFMVKGENAETKSPAHYLTPMIKFDYLDCESAYLDTQATKQMLPYGASTIIAVGFNYEISECAYFQFFYEMRGEEKDKSDFIPTSDASAFHNDQFIVQLNFKF